ncbi:DUF389 domain-containing protein [Thermomonas alba]|uniref:DUF389 domain-containing protein n=1 Tax=Thermomonas alba TaxID=2888525 RepID=UPI001F0336D0|nr:DUF389 domain-containing protein [Thermomonas alba]
MDIRLRELVSPLVWWRWARQWRQVHVVGRIDRIAVLEHVHDSGQLGPRYAFMVVLSCGIATLGLLQNSAAVIIGAMLISPLMGPIINLGMGLATFDLRTVRESLVSLGAGIALALAIAMAIVWLSPLQEATSEILARTRPTLFDLLVAILSGLAGAYATVTRKGETIVGVAIATALMPPLAVVGFGVAVANWAIAGGAAFLFMTNLLAIALSVTIIARWYGFGGADSPKQTAWQAMLIVSTFLLLSIPLGLALQRIARQSRTELAVRATLEAEAARVHGRVSTLRVDASNQRVLVDVVLMLPSHVARLEAVLETRLQRAVGHPVDVSLREIVTADDAAIARQQSTLAELRRSVLALEDREQTRASQQQAQADARARMLAAVAAQLGRLQRSDDGRGWVLRLAPENRIPLARARQIERELNAAAAPGTLQVIPALQTLPAILPGDVSLDAPEADASLQAQLDAQAWALQRWHSGAVDVLLATRSNAQAHAWEQAVRATLATHQLPLGRVQWRREAPARVQLMPASE